MFVRKEKEKKRKRKRERENCLKSDWNCSLFLININNNSITIDLNKENFCK